MLSFTDPQTRGYARTAGLLYLTIAVAGGFAIAFVPAQLQVAGDAAATFANIAARRGLFDAGIAGDVVMMMAEVMVTAMLYFMFRPVNPTLALAATFARLGMALVMASMLFFHAAALRLADPGAAMASLPMPMRIDLAGLMLHVHDAGVWIWQLFFTLHLALLGWLVARSGRYPRLLGQAMTLGAFGYLLDSLIGFAGTGATAPLLLRNGLLAVVTLAEVGFALWLVFRGPRGTAA
jgi:hypothetical protein